MMKTLKVGLLGVMLGAVGAVILPAQEAEAQSGACCSSCNPNFQRCLNSSGNNAQQIALCNLLRSICESSCSRTC
ncbi:hypothetical protein [Cystobacter fuscus]|uniref:hypothetical protein n=1 Tax=Cystobacter fuscus TaxID=43 RepID=UPI002B30CEDF|nr:hypothetical protein F0U63_33835 [Cystobacter fuscus]